MPAVMYTPSVRHRLQKRNDAFGGMLDISSQPPSKKQNDNGNDWCTTAPQQEAGGHEEVWAIGTLPQQEPW